MAEGSSKKGGAKDAGAGEAGKRYGGTERRKDRRVKVKLHMVYEDERKNAQANVIDLSMGGAFIEMASPPAEGTRIRLTPILPEQKEAAPSPVAFQGKVVRVVEYDLTGAGGGKGIGVGVQFLGVSDRERGLLSEIFRSSGEAREPEAHGGERPTTADDARPTTGKDKE